LELGRLLDGKVVDILALKDSGDISRGSAIKWSAELVQLNLEAILAGGEGRPR
jgi:hypothetical protein